MAQDLLFHENRPKLSEEVVSPRARETTTGRQRVHSLSLAYEQGHAVSRHTLFSLTAYLSSLPQLQLGATRWLLSSLGWFFWPWATAASWSLRRCCSRP